LGAWEAERNSRIDAGEFDHHDMAAVVAAIRRWHSDGLWAA